MCWCSWLTSSLVVVVVGDGRRGLPGDGDLVELGGEQPGAGDGRLHGVGAALVGHAPQHPGEDLVMVGFAPGPPVPLIGLALADHGRQVFGAPVDLDKPAQLPPVGRGDFDQQIRAQRLHPGGSGESPPGVTLMTDVQAGHSPGPVGLDQLHV